MLKMSLAAVSARPLAPFFPPPSSPPRDVNSSLIGLAELLTSPSKTTSMCQKTVPDESGQQSPITVTLVNASKWECFHKLGTEMIVNREGRRTFPYLELKLDGLRPKGRYDVEMFAEQVDRRLYYFVHSSKEKNKSEWRKGTKTNKGKLPFTKFVHPHSPATGEQWMARTVSFKRAKLTNYMESRNPHMKVYSMHKYRPVFIITMRDDDRGEALPELVKYRFSFDLTEFVAVTSYQNPLMTALKKKTNPYCRCHLVDEDHHGDESDSTSYMDQHASQLDAMQSYMMLSPESMQPYMSSPHMTSHAAMATSHPLPTYPVSQHNFSQSANMLPPPVYQTSQLPTHPVRSSTAMPVTMTTIQLSSDEMTTDRHAHGISWEPSPFFQSRQLQQASHDMERVFHQLKETSLQPGYPNWHL